MKETFPKDDNHCTCRRQTTRERPNIYSVYATVSFRGARVDCQFFSAVEPSENHCPDCTTNSWFSLSLFLCGSFSYLLNCYHITIADVTQIRQRRHDYGTPLRLPAAVDADTHTQTAHSHRFLSSKNKLRDLLR